jgi:hypothetical protein
MPIEAGTSHVGHVIDEDARVFAGFRGRSDAERSFIARLPDAKPARRTTPLSHDGRASPLPLSATPSLQRGFREFPGIISQDA